MYYFDKNNLVDAKYTVDAEKEFALSDYVVTAQPSADESDVVIPTNANDVALTTVDAVNADICSRIPSDDVKNGRPFLMNCVFDNIPYLYDIFDGINSCMSIDEVNELVQTGDNANVKFKIGEKYYKFSLSTSPAEYIDVECGYGAATKLLAGTPIWTEVK